MKKKILFGFGHPAHFHLYKNVIETLKESGNEILIVISNKDILKELLNSNNWKYITIAEGKPNEGIIQKLFKLVKSSIKLYEIVHKQKPDILVGCLSQLGIVGKITNKHTIFNAEDDIDYTYLQAILTYPFITTIVTPSVTNVGFFSYKRIAYNGYHKLSYLHPNRFIPKKSIVEKYNLKNPYFMVRTVNQDAYHDVNASGITISVLSKILKTLTKYGNVYISSEKELHPNFKDYQLNIDVKDIHHILYYSDLFIADSQSMTVEAAMLGTYSVKFNNFAGKISVLNELEKKYKLTKGYNTKQENEFIQEIKNIVTDKKNKSILEKRKNKMLTDKIDVTAFLVWFVENYPKSKQIVKENPEFPNRFK